jgi:hypothetical protein
MTRNPARHPAQEISFSNELHLTLRPGAGVIGAPGPDGRPNRDLLPGHQRPDGPYREETT